MDPSNFKVYHGIDVERQILPPMKEWLTLLIKNAVITQESCVPFSRLP